MKAICVLAVFLLAAVATSAPKSHAANQSQAHAFLSADPIPICPYKVCPHPVH